MALRTSRTSFRPSFARHSGRTFLALAIAAVFAAGVVLPAAALEGTLDETEGTTLEVVEDTTEETVSTLEEELDDVVEETTGGSGDDPMEETVEDMGETVEEAVEEIEETVDELEETVDDVVDKVTGTIDDLLDGDDGDPPGGGDDDPPTSSEDENGPEEGGDEAAHRAAGGSQQVLAASHAGSLAGLRAMRSPDVRAAPYRSHGSELRSEQVVADIDEVLARFPQAAPPSSEAASGPGSEGIPGRNVPLAVILATALLVLVTAGLNLEVATRRPTG